MWICQICFISTWLFFSIVYCFLIINVIHLVSFLILIFDGKTVDWSSETCKVLVNKMPFLINIHQRKVTGMNIFSSNGFFFLFLFLNPKMDILYVIIYIYLIFCLIPSLLDSGEPSELLKLCTRTFLGTWILLLNSV